jgi:hypothetical protein
MIVRLFYNSTSLPDAYAFGGSLPFPASLVIYYEATASNPIKQFFSAPEPIVMQVQQNGQSTSSVQTIQQQPSGTLVSVCGVEGVVQSEGTGQASLVWWNNGVLYLIWADLSTSQLLNIASSMC